MKKKVILTLHLSHSYMLNLSHSNAPYNSQAMQWAQFLSKARGCEQFFSKFFSNYHILFQEQGKMIDQINFLTQAYRLGARFQAHLSSSTVCFNKIIILSLDRGLGSTLPVQLACLTFIAEAMTIGKDEDREFFLERLRDDEAWIFFMVFLFEHEDQFMVQVISKIVCSFYHNDPDFTEYVVVGARAEVFLRFLKVYCNPSLTAGEREAVVQTVVVLS